MQKKSFSPLLQVFFLFLVYVVAGHLCVRFREISGFNPLLWVPTGIATASLLLISIRLWPIFFVGGFFVFLSQGNSIFASLAVAVGTTSGPYVSTAILNRFFPKLSFSRVKDVLAFVMISILLSTLMSSTIEVAGLYLIGAFPPERLLHIWQFWWIGEGMGNLMIGAACVSWATDIRYRMGRRFKLNFEIVGMALLIIIISVFIFTPLSEYNHTLIIKPYFLFSIFILTAIRFDLLGVAFANFTVSATVMIGVVEGFIPFPTYAFDDRMIVAQYFLGVLGITGLVLAAAIREKEMAVDARSEFIDVASHELKTPITSLSLQLQLIQRKLNQITNKSDAELEQLKFFKKANRQADRLIQIVEQILDVSRIERDVLALHLEEVNLLSIVESLKERFASDLLAHKNDIEVDIAPNIILNVDPFRIEQALDNVISNAIKYAPGTTIRMTAKMIGQNVELAIKDQGPGIEETKQPNIFDRFVRVSETSHVNGLGLGLFITRQIMEAHGGSITVKSKTGEGTAFHLSIPLPISTL